MGAELNAVREQRDYWQQKAQQLEQIGGDGNASVPLFQMVQSQLTPSPNRAEFGLLLSAETSEVLKAYEITTAPMLLLPVPAFDSHSLARLECMCLHGTIAVKTFLSSTFSFCFRSDRHEFTDPGHARVWIARNGSRRSGRGVFLQS